MKLHVKFRWMALAFGAWSYGHAWLSALATSDRIQALATLEAVIAGLAALALGVASVATMEGVQ